MFYNKNGTWNLRPCSSIFFWCKNLTLNNVIWSTHLPWRPSPNRIAVRSYHYPCCNEKVSRFAGLVVCIFVSLWVELIEHYRSMKPTSVEIRLNVYPTLRQSTTSRCKSVPIMYHIRRDWSNFPPVSFTRRVQSVVGIFCMVVSKNHTSYLLLFSLVGNCLWIVKAASENLHP